VLTEYPVFRSPSWAVMRFLGTKQVLSQAPRPDNNRRHDKPENEINAFTAHTIVASKIPYGVKFSAVVFKTFSEGSSSSICQNEFICMKFQEGKCGCWKKKIRNVPSEISIKAVRTQCRHKLYLIHGVILEAVLLPKYHIAI
jgi:hypothetical protein